MQALQTELMFAGLNCNGQKHYDYFVHNYRFELKASAEALQRYFQRVYGQTAELEMKQFTTQLANESSGRFIKQSAALFCEDARIWFDVVEQENHVENIAFSYRGDIRECP